MSISARVAALVFVAGLAWAGSGRAEPEKAREVVQKSDLAGRVFTLAPSSAFLRKGVSEKYLFVDSTGQIWLFKPMSEAEAYLEEAAWRLAARCGLAAAEVYSVSIKGPDGDTIVGSLGRILPDLKGSLAGSKPETLDQEQIAQLQVIQVFRWILADFDTHGNNFLLDKAGHVITIDHSKAFDPNMYFEYDLKTKRPFPIYSYYAPLFEAFVAGKISLDVRRPFAFIDAVARVPAATIDGIFRPYAAMVRRANGHVLKNWKGHVAFRDEAEFVFAVQKRILDLREGFEKFYGILFEERGQGAFRPPAVGAEPARPQPDASVDAWPIDASPRPLNFTDDARTFSAEKRAKAKQAAFLGNRAMLGDLDTALRGAQYFVWYATQPLKDFFYREVLAEVKSLDLEALTFDDGFKKTLEKLPVDVLRTLKARAAFAANHPEASPKVRENGAKLGLWVDQARAAQTNHGFGPNPAQP